MGWIIPAMIAAGAVSGMLSNKDKHKDQTSSWTQQQQMTPYDFNPGMSGNQGNDLLNQILQSYQGLLGNAIGKFQQRPQGNQLQNMLSSMNSDFYKRRGQ